jgi:hypothetical protein
VLVALSLCALGVVLWRLHMRAWDLGGRSPALSYDSAQYALAARELADHGRLATTFALPVELARHAAPPWPLAVVQPGLVLLEAALFKAPAAWLGWGTYDIGPDPRQWLAVLISFLAYLAVGAGLALGVARILARSAPDVGGGWAAAAGFVVGAAFLLDPEAQHFGSGGFTEVPYLAGFLFVLVGLALERAPRWPLLFGIAVGLTGSLRATMLPLVPVVALGAMLLAAPGRRLRVLGRVLAGYALIAAPWWLYKWRAFGSPGWDLTRLVLWEGVQGRTWSALVHLPQMPDVPTGSAAVALLARKVAHNLPGLLLLVFTGPRALWLGAIALWALLVRQPRCLVVAACVVLVAFVTGLLGAAASIPWLRYVFPARIAVEAAGLFATWGLIAYLVGSWRDPRARLLFAFVALLALGWGVHATRQGLAEARTTAANRDVPQVDTLDELSMLVNHQVPPAETVMSNLGPLLAWSARRAVVHLTLGPDDLAACRRRLDFRQVILVFRNADRAGPEWGEIFVHPDESRAHADWNIKRWRVWTSSDGFRIVWLELGPLPPGLAGRAPTGAGRISAGTPAG